MYRRPENVAALIEKHNKPELAKEGGMVWQVWQDGEMTLQKSGDLLWQRTLHTIASGREDKMVDPEMFPDHLSAPGCAWGRHGFIFTDEEGANAVRDAILAG